MRLLDNGGWGFAATTMLEAPPALSDLVEHLWIDDSRIHRTLPGNYRIVADITPHIIVNVAHPGNAVSATMSLVGARSRHLDVDTSRRALTVAVAFIQRHYLDSACATRRSSRTVRCHCTSCCPAR
jgi:hypothetical protein